MLNHISNEAFHSAMYVDNYLDAMENLPDEIQRLITRIRELDVKHRSCLRDVDTFYEQWANCSSHELLEGPNATKRNRAMTRIQQSLIAAQEIGDEKITIVTQLTEIIESKTRTLEQNFINLDYGKEEQILSDIALKDTKSQTPPYPAVSSSLSSTYVSSTLNITNTNSVINLNQVGNGSNERSNKRIRRGRTDIAGADIDIGAIVAKQDVSTNNLSVHKKVSSTNLNAKKKRKKTGRQSNQGRDNRDETPPIEETIDPDEPTYCLCDQISFGEMILCDNDLCPIEWFHFSCVALMVKPKGKWFCPNCRGDRPNIMKPKAQFLKELERYNKEKEEKT